MKALLLTAVERDVKRAGWSSASRQQPTDDDLHEMICIDRMAIAAAMAGARSCRSGNFIQWGYRAAACGILLLLLLFLSCVVNIVHFSPLFSSALRALMGSSPSFSTSSHSTPVAEKLWGRYAPSWITQTYQLILLSLSLSSSSSLIFSGCFIQTGFLCMVELLLLLPLSFFFRIIERMEFPKIIRYADMPASEWAFSFHLFSCEYIYYLLLTFLFLSMRKREEAQCLAVYYKERKKNFTLEATV